MLFPSLAKSLTLALLATNAVVSALPMASHDDDDNSSSLTTKSRKTKSHKTKTFSSDGYSPSATSSGDDSDSDDGSDSDSTSTKSTKTKKHKATSTAAKASTAVAVASGSSVASSGSSSGSGVSGSVFGYASLNGGTTGGASGKTVTATTLEELTSYCAQEGALTIYVTGAISSSGSSGYSVTVSSDKSIIGKSGASLTNVGFYLKDVSNVIIQNLTISKVIGTDAVRVLKSTNVWLDHLDVSSDQDHGKDYYDGLIDITHASDYITVSYVHFHDHEKTSLVGHSDSNGSEDTGHLTVTYAYNFWENLNSRGPSLRFGTGHIYNNYYDNMNDCINIRKGAKALVENNVFAGSSSKGLYSVDGSGSAQASGNDFGSASDSIDSTTLSMEYKYSLKDAGDVASYVQSNAGATL
ncbi:unnamed protein product [Ambrosiozyma monospora]|uniref:Unnamed protein product n=1 Tax=Ambrosiozyma monospora TaxID=43982 RepID=A0A9W6YPH4_AMBMO|nr:unnamed protein product [Ambrosiozyma monospora]